MNTNKQHIDSVLAKYDIYVHLDRYQLIYLLESKNIFDFRDNVIEMITYVLDECDNDEDERVVTLIQLCNREFAINYYTYIS